MIDDRNRVWIELMIAVLALIASLFLIIWVFRIPAVQFDSSPYDGGGDVRWGELSDPWDEPGDQQADSFEPREGGGASEGYRAVPSPEVGGLPEYRGGVSRGRGWELVWDSPIRQGARPIDVVHAAIDNLSHRQRTAARNDRDARLLYDLIKAVERYEGEESTPSVRDILKKGAD
ncbi:MAG: hypothetical protein KatS3mg109_0032 [Pirellulaceae bacterium]|nr:MAG: hypothetical protein KatS3mg109_0032 [Pirellulaceae bacterium]